MVRCLCVLIEQACKIWVLTGARTVTEAMGHLSYELPTAYLYFALIFPIDNSIPLQHPFDQLLHRIVPWVCGKFVFQHAILIIYHVAGYGAEIETI